MRYQNKYYNIKTKASDGIIFDSTKEARRWEQLLLLQKAGKISSLQRQVRYELVPAQYETRIRYSTKTGRRLKDQVRLVERGVVYVADFVYTEAESGALVVEDVKSEATKTPEFIIKRKLMLAVHGIKVKEV